MDESLDKFLYMRGADAIEQYEGYFQYLYEIVELNGYSGRYRCLLRVMHETMFYNPIERDKNRMNDVYDLLREPYNETVDIYEMMVPNHYEPSVLEVLIALCVRLIDMIGDDNEYRLDVPELFWELVLNMCLLYFDDTEFEYNGDSADCEVRHRLNDFVLRTYAPDGTDGGAFPVLETRLDMRKTELWYQAMEYFNVFYPV